MKTLGLSATLMLLGILTLGMSATVDEQIATIQTASPQERVRLVNEFKTNLSNLSQEERVTAIEKFRSSLGNGDKTKTRERVRERVRVNQMDETQLRQENQRMNQNQIGSQYLQQNPGAGSNPDNAGKFMKK